MRSLKPGRGPSWLAALASGVAALLVVGWICFSRSMGAPPLFAWFGVGMLVLLVAKVVYHVTNASAQRRMSVLDVVDGDEEPDLLAPTAAQRFCPACGARSLAAHRFCSECGKPLAGGPEIRS